MLFLDLQVAVHRWIRLSKRRTSIQQGRTFATEILLRSRRNVVSDGAEDAFHASLKGDFGISCTRLRHKKGIVHAIDDQLPLDVFPECAHAGIRCGGHDLCLQSATRCS